MRNIILLIAGVFTFEPTFSAQSNISKPEAKKFLEQKMAESFPDQDIPVAEERIVFVQRMGLQSICFSNECWPVTKRGNDVVDLALEAAAKLGKVRVVFSRTGRIAPKVHKIYSPDFAINLDQAIYVADILRFLQKYRQYSPYNVKFAPRKDVAGIPNWIEGQYWSEGGWLNSKELLLQYANVQHLEIQYDGSPGDFLSLTAERLGKLNNILEGYVALSPWTIFPTAILKDGKEQANLVDKYLLPAGPREGDVTWVNAGY